MFDFFRKKINNKKWEKTINTVTLPKTILGAKKIRLYLKVVPASADYDLDNVKMEIAKGNKQGIFQHEKN